MHFEALFSYGSTLCGELRRPDSVPDRFALVEDLPHTLTALGHARLARCAERLIPPITIAHEGGKLSLCTRAVAERELSLPRDLYLAGRLSKKLEIVHGDVSALVDRAREIVIETASLGFPRRLSLDEAIYRCLEISYLGDVRPEGEHKIRALHSAFAGFYRQQLSPLLEAHARRRGILVEEGQLYDARGEAVRARERAELGGILLRSRLRAVQRWPQQLLIFDGAPSYVLGKLRRALQWEHGDRTNRRSGAAQNRASD